MRHENLDLRPGVETAGCTYGEVRGVDERLHDDLHGSVHLYQLITFAPILSISEAVR